VEVHVDLNQGGCDVDGGGSVGASASVAQEYHDALSPSRHEDFNFVTEKPLENVVPAVSVVASPVCLRPTMFLKYR